MLRPLQTEACTVDKVDLRLLVDFARKLGKVAESDIKKEAALDLFMSGSNANNDMGVVLAAFPTLKVCRPAAEQFSKAVDELGTHVGTNAAEIVTYWANDPAKSGTDYLKFGSIITAAKEFQTVFQADLRTIAAYQVAQKGAYSIEKLVESAEEAFPPKSLSKLTNEVISEIREAGRCLAYDIPTACGFHMLRASELVIHDYYVAILKPAKKDKLPDWGTYIDKLRHSSDAHAKKVAELLQHLKNQHRNLIMHPDVVLSDEEAATLFELGKTSIMVMTEKLRPAKR